MATKEVIRFVNNLFNLFNLVPVIVFLKVSKKFMKDKIIIFKISGFFLSHVPLYLTDRGYEVVINHKRVSMTKKMHDDWSICKFDDVGMQLRVQNSSHNPPGKITTFII